MINNATHRTSAHERYKQYTTQTKYDTRLLLKTSKTNHLPRGENTAGMICRQETHSSHLYIWTIFITPLKTSTTLQNAIFICYANSVTNIVNLISFNWVLIVSLRLAFQKQRLKKNIVWGSPLEVIICICMCCWFCCCFVV